VAEAAAVKMVEVLGKDSFNLNVVPGKSIEITEIVNVGDTKEKRERILRMECNDMFSLESSTMARADIIMLETDIPNHLQDNLCYLLSQVRDGTHILTYLDLRKISSGYNTLHYRQIESNKSLSYRFPTSWSVQRGHHFFLWVKESQQQQQQTKENKNIFSNGTSSASIFSENHSEISEFEDNKGAGGGDRNKSKNINSSNQIATHNRPWGCLPTFNLRNIFG
jgi:hypothetical protein